MFSHSVTTAPATLPVALTTIKSHVRVTHNYDDVILQMYAQAATALVESYTARALITQSCQFVSTSTMTPLSVQLTYGPLAVYPMWFNPILSNPLGRRIELLRSPAQSIESVTVIAADGSTTLLDPAQYFVDLFTSPAAIILTGHTLLPQDQLIVAYTAGYGDTVTSVPVALQNAVLWLTGYMYSHRGDDEINEMPHLAKMLCDPYRLTFFAGVAVDGR